MSEDQEAPSIEEPKEATGTSKGTPRHLPFAMSVVAFVLALGILAGVIEWGSLPKERILYFYQPLFAGLSALLALWFVVYATWRGPVKWWLGVPLFLFTYYGAEQLAAPSFIRVWKLSTFTALEDPDHHPKHTNPKQGWNSDSLRCPYESEEFAEEGTNIIILGDSFTFGMKLKPKQCFPYHVERRLNGRFPGKDIKVANFGWVSSSPLLSWRRLKSIGEDYKPDMVVICVDMTDIRDDIRWRSMLQREGMYGVIGELPIATYWIQRWSPKTFKWLFAQLNPGIPQRRFFMSEAPLQETRPYFAEIEKNLGRIKSWCDERGVHFVTMILPRTYQYSDRECPKNWEKGEYTVLGPHSLEPFRFFEELEQRVDYPIYSLLKPFQETEIFPTSFEDDPHWNADGAQLASKEVTKILLGELRKLKLP